MGSLSMIFFATPWCRNL